MKRRPGWRSPPPVVSIWDFSHVFRRGVPAYWLAVAEGLNVDFPRNLAKSVTVE